MNRATELNVQGIRFKQQGEFAKAEACYEQAVQLDPSCAEVHYNLGLLLRDLGRANGAIDCLERSAALRPDIADIQLELGQLYLSEWRWHDAERSFEQLLKISPRNVDALLGTATAFHQQGKLVDAVAAYQVVLQEQPQHSAARTNLGIALKGLGNVAEAIQCFEHALQANPSQMEARVNLGNSLLECGRFAEALEVYRVAAELQPFHPLSHVNLGNALQRQQRIREAMDSYRRAIELDPRCTDAWVNTTHLLKEIGDFDQARQTATALSKQYSSDPVHALRSAAVCPLVFRDRTELDEYREHFVTIANAISLTSSQLEFERWTVYAPECPYNLQFLDGNLRPLKESFARIYAPAISRMQPAKLTTPRRKRPRVGFVVTARHEQAFLKLFGGVINRLSRERWELVCLCSQVGHEKLRHGLNPEIAILAFPERFDHIVAAVSEAACDLLYYWEVGNDPTNYFLPFLRLAPVQVTSWGIQVTTGIPNVDAYLSSELVEGNAADEHYSERLIAAKSLLTYQIPVNSPPTPRCREAFGLSENQHVYGCVQNLGKFHPDFDVVLAEILRRDRSGIVVAARDQNGYAARVLQNRWQATMPDIASQLMLIDPLAQPDYLSLLATCDVLLDPLHFGGVTTTYDAVALHQPVVTLPTCYHRGRYTAACLRRIGVTETIARDVNDYVKIAVELGVNPDFRHEIRTQLQRLGRELFEDQKAVSEHERIFEELLSTSR